MKVTVEFEVERNGTDYYLINGQRWLNSNIQENLPGVLEAFEAAQPVTFERDGYTIQQVNSWWVVGNRDVKAIVDARSSEEAWTHVAENAKEGYMHEFVKPAAVLAEFLEERGL